MERNQKVGVLLPDTRVSSVLITFWNVRVLPNDLFSIQAVVYHVGRQ